MIVGASVRAEASVAGVADSSSSAEMAAVVVAAAADVEGRAVSAAVLDCSSDAGAVVTTPARSEERRVGREGRSRGWTDH